MKFSSLLTVASFGFIASALPVPAELSDAATSAPADVAAAQNFPGFGGSYNLNGLGGSLRGGGSFRGGNVGGNFAFRPPTIPIAFPSIVLPFGGHFRAVQPDTNAEAVNAVSSSGAESPTISEKQIETATPDTIPVVDEVETQA